MLYTLPFPAVKLVAMVAVDPTHTFESLHLTTGSHAIHLPNMLCFASVTFSLSDQVAPDDYEDRCEDKPHHPDRVPLKSCLV
jgi:hypothetical protein